MIFILYNIDTMKKLSLAACFCVLFCGSSWAQSTENGYKISAVAIEGLRNVKEKTVKGQIKSKAGKNYSEETVRSDIKNILGLNFFEDVEVAVDTATWRLTFQVKEK